MRSYLSAYFNRLSVNPHREEFKKSITSMALPEVAHTDNLRNDLDERGYQVDGEKIVVSNSSEAKIPTIRSSFKQIKVLQTLQN